MSERATTEVKTKNGHVVAIKTYLTAGERRAIDTVIFERATFTVEGQTAKIGELNGTVMNALQDEHIKQLVVSVDGSPDVVQACLALPEEDFKEVAAELDRIVTVDAKKKT